MCGIIGIASNKPVSVNIINSLKKLEYRGYDSAGIATLSEGEINEVKSEGRVDNLENNFDLKNLRGNIGIGHVRWATNDEFEPTNTLSLILVLFLCTPS